MILTLLTAKSAGETPRIHVNTYGDLVRRRCQICFCGLDGPPFIPLPVHLANGEGCNTGDENVCARVPDTEFRGPHKLRSVSLGEGPRPLR